MGSTSKADTKDHQFQEFANEFIYYSMVFANALHFTAIPDSSGGRKELYAIFEAWFYSYNNSSHTRPQEAAEQWIDFFR